MIQVVGTNHKYSPLGIREALAADGGFERVLAKRARAELGASECVVVCTCNRLELYYVGPSGDGLGPAAKQLICEAGQAGDRISEDRVYHHVGTEAACHLFRVACGLDSMVLGEHEILGQVKAALVGALSSGYAGPILKRLFQQAVRAGKRARRETAISSGIFSVGQCAARMAMEVLHDIRGKQVLVFGAGRIAKVTAKHMVSLGAGRVTVFSRTYERAEALASLVGGRAVRAEALPEVLGSSDIVVGCAAAPHHLITADQIREATQGRDGRPLVVVDLGVPRNVDPAVEELPGVHLFNLDHLEAVVGGHAREREAEVARVQAIVSEESCAFHQWRGGAKASTAVSELRTRAEEARQECLRLAARRGLSERDLATADYVTDLLVRKLLHRPLTALREAAGGGEPQDADLLAAAERLFGLGEPAQARELEQGCEGAGETPAGSAANNTGDGEAT